MDFCRAVLVSAVATLALGVSSTTAAENFRVPTQVPMQSVDSEQARLRGIDFAMAPVKSDADLAAYLRTAGRDSPLMALSPAARRRFLDSLTFNESGLVGYNYEELARELTASQAYKVLALFGAQRTTHLLGARVVDAADAAVSTPARVPRLMQDYRDYKCVSPHNCYGSRFYICLTGC